MCLLTLALLLPSLVPTLRPLLHPRALERSLREQFQRLAYRIETRFYPPTLVLLYHRVLPEAPNDGFQLAVTCAHFRDQLQWLNQHTRVIPLDQLWDPPGDRRPRVVITFDDGYRDNLVHAASLLDECRLPATFYLTCGYIGTERRFWWDETYARCKAEDTEATPAPLVARVQRLCSELRRMPAGKRETLLRNLGEEPPPAHPIDLPMTWDEARELQRLGFTLGAHSMNHPALTELREEEAFWEVYESRRALEAQTSGPARHFCYPYDEAIRWKRRLPARLAATVRAAGFASAVTVVTGAVSRRTSALAVPRIAIGDWPLERFTQEVGCYLSPAERSRTLAMKATDELPSTTEIVLSPGEG